MVCKKRKIERSQVKFCSTKHAFEHKSCGLLSCAKNKFCIHAFLPFSGKEIPATKEIVRAHSKGHCPHLLVYASSTCQVSEEETLCKRPFLGSCEMFRLDQPVLSFLHACSETKPDWQSFRHLWLICIFCSIINWYHEVDGWCA